MQCSYCTWGGGGLQFDFIDENGGKNNSYMQQLFFQ